MSYHYGGHHGSNFWRSSFATTAADAVVSHYYKQAREQAVRRKFVGNSEYAVLEVDGFSINHNGGTYTTDWQPDDPWALQNLHDREAAREKDGVKALVAARTGTQTQQKDKKMPIQIEPADYTRARLKRGRKYRRNLKNLWKITANDRNSIIYRYLAANNFCDGNCGKVKLFNYRTSEATPKWFMPVHVWDLSSYWNSTSGNQGPFQSECGQPYLDGGVLKWANMASSILNTGVPFNVLPNGADDTTPNWQVEKYKNATCDYDPGRQDMLEWLDIKMICYGRSNKPTRWRIDLCFIPDDDINPYKCNATSALPGVGAWENAIAPFHWNPIISSNAPENVRRMFKSVLHYDFILAGDSSIDAVSIPPMRKVTMFYRANRRQNYDWAESDNLGVDPNGAVAPGATGGDDDWIQQTANYQKKPHWRSRLYLVIRAQSTHWQNSTEGTSAPQFLDQGNNKAVNFPSYDIQIRKKHIG